MKKLLLSLFLCVSLVVSSIAVLAADAPRVDDFGDWARIFPDSPFPLTKTDKGLNTTMKNGYAAGFALKEKVAVEGFQIDFTLDAFPTYDSKRFGIWYMVALEDDKIMKNEKTWIFESTGVVVLILPKDAKTVEFSMRYKTPTGKLEGSDATQLATASKYSMVFKKNEIFVNGKKLKADKAKIESIFKALNGKAHPTIGMYNSTPAAKPTSMTVQKCGSKSYVKTTKK